MARTTKTTSSTAKPAARKAPGSKPVAKSAPRKPVAKPAEPVVASVKLAVAPPPEAGIAAAPVVTLRKKEFLERVVTASGAKKKDAREVIEATLRLLGEALAKGESVLLPPFGKARVSRHVDKKGGELLVIKLRRSEEGGAKKASKTDDEALAEAAD